jgi:4-hydroxy-3-polyprenylbenzoate decarboxylase
MPKKERVVVGISGASGAVYGVRLLQFLAEIPSLEIHLIISRAAEYTLQTELGMTAEQITPPAALRHAIDDIGAPVASGSFLTRGMVILPCSIKTLSGIANSYSQNLLLRAADVTLKERRPLILGVRETPFHVGHLRLMTQAAEIGALIAPPIPSFYNMPSSVDDLINQYVCRVLDWLRLPCPPHKVYRWQGNPSTDSPNLQK